MSRNSRAVFRARFCIAVALFALDSPAPAIASDICATADQARHIREFYVANPGTLPVVAARKLGLPEAVVTSGLGEERVASARSSAFADVWSAMASWEQANFLIMKGQNVFEILSGVSPGAPSKTSQYFNINYEHPLRGHLRPDQFAAIFAVAIPAEDKTVLRGVLFYDDDGSLVFGAFISGEALKPSESELRKFDDVMELIRAQPPVCPDSWPEAD